MRLLGWGLFCLLGALFLMGSTSPAPAAPAAVTNAPGDSALLPTATPSLTPPPLSGCWTVSTPDPHSERAVLLAVATVGAGEAWAVGSQYSLAGCGVGVCPQAQHWDGTTWIEQSPALASQSQLAGVSGVSPNDVWAVGWSAGTNSAITHWNGSGWSTVPAPNIGRLNAVAARAADDAWAVGEQILHWDGTAWTLVAGPAGVTLNAVAALTASDAWAVGTQSNGSSTTTLSAHWNGSAWAMVPSPNVGTGNNSLTGVAVLAANNAWAVGSYDNNGTTLTLILHWDGLAWTVVPSPNVGSGANGLHAVSAAAANDVWAVGSYTGDSDLQSLTLHWNGILWNVVPAPNIGWDDNVLYGVATAGPNAAWAVGNYYEPLGTSGHQDTILHYVDPCPPPPPPPCGPGFQRVPAPGDNPLHAIAALAPDDIWAAGARFTHWDGFSWLDVPSPLTSTVFNGLAALGPNNIWAVGTNSSGPLARTAIAHWDGSTWTPVPSPNVPAAPSFLQAVAARAATDIWAVGSFGSGNTAQPLILHWDGLAWSITPSPPNGILYGVVALAANDAWAVGGRILLHWDGTAWTSVTMPVYTELHGIAALAPNDIWAVGYRGGTWTFHWDGSTWTAIPSAVGYNLYAVAALAPNDVWAVGGFSDGTYTHPIAEHWDGSGWQPVTADMWGDRYQNLFAVGAAGANAVWAVGEEAGDALTEHFVGPCLTPTATPLPTAPPTVPPSMTPTVPAASPTVPPTVPPTLPPTAPPTVPPTVTGNPASPTPTACTISFSDVPPSNPFYPYIRCLACRGIISGYADGTFRWGTEVTRGQLAKIIANAAGLQNGIPTTQQTFADVPYANPFWLFIERLTAGGAISGYDCGGPGEPCDAQQRKYFRWGANATRGQIAKIAAVAANVTDPIPSTQQTFTDVPNSNPFWVYIERLAGRGIISGYDCGGPGEPCDAQQRKYFRWGSPATRGQLSKIAANTFYPGCQTPARE